MANRLASQQSPYLLQHKDNPVDWFPWGEEAFARARDEDKPIFLSIGYSTCHWCHVMEHESFENPQVAAVLNSHFVSIKVDREERPDVDRVYMTFVQATTGSGGWPMSVWLTPSLEPFYGGTYYPPTSRWGRSGFIEVLEEITRVWRDERPAVVASAANIVERLRALAGVGRPGAIPGPQVLETATREFAATFDQRRGGFGDAPKFPRPSELLFLLREHYRTGAPVAREMVLTTLRAMAQGGMRDHIGGGFHRYSVDGDWRVPHFEKMLYDQAQLVLAFLEAAQLTGDPFFADVARDTLDYVRRDMTDPAGGFYSAEDADSIPPEQSGRPDARKMEGAFYIWRDDEVGEALGADAGIFRARYGMLPDGNAPSDPQQEFTHKNLLYTARSIEDIARDTSRPAAEIEQALGRARQVLQEVRASRPRPHLDDKVLTAWNGLMIAAFARAARVLPVDGGPAGRNPPRGAASYVADAQRAAVFIRSTLWDDTTETLLRRYRRGDAMVHAYAEDYAYLIFGLLELLQADGDPSWLRWAVALQRRQDELFWDAENGGWFSTTGRDASVLLRLKEDYDGAEPAASSVSLLNVLTLAHLTGDRTFSERIEATFTGFAGRIAQAGRAVPMLLAALSTYHAGLPQIVLAGEAVATQPLADIVRQHYLPSAIVLPIVPQHREAMAEALPWTAAMSTGDGSARAYVCREFSCERPASEARALEAQLEALSPR